jgi:hypothetical protein
MVVRAHTLCALWFYCLGLLGYIDSLDKDKIARPERNARYIFLMLSNGLGVVCATMRTFYFEGVWWNERKELMLTFKTYKLTLGFVG